MSEPERRSRVACWRRPSGDWYVFSAVGAGGFAGFVAHFWGRRRGDDLLGWGWVLVRCSVLRMEESGEESGVWLGD